MSLPSGYTKLQWIESTGTQYIKTGIYHTAATCPGLRMVLDATMLSTSGLVISGAASYQSFYVGEMSGTIYYSTYYGDNTTGISYSAQKRYVYDLDNANSKFTLRADGATVYEANTTVGVASGSKELYLFGYNSADAGSANPSAQRIYSCKLYQSGSLARDFIPCKNASGTVGLWDDVGSQFYTNVGTGTFTAGPAAEWTELQWIESSGTQWINTGWQPNGAAQRIVMDFMWTESGNTSLFGCSSGGTYTGITPYKQTLAMYVGTSNGILALSSAAALDTRHTIDVAASGGTLTRIFNGTTQTASYSGNLSGNVSIALLACSYDGTAQEFTKGRLYACKIYSGSALVRDYVPAKTVEDEVGLYDRVNNEFYRNAGTGSFTAGPLPLQPPTAPTNFQSILAVVLSWTAAERAESYKLYRDGTLLGTTTTTQYVDTTVEANETYVYSIKAVNTAGESAATEVTVYTKTGYFEYKPLIQDANFP